MDSSYHEQLLESKKDKILKDIVEATVWVLSFVKR